MSSCLKNQCFFLFISVVQLFFSPFFLSFNFMCVRISTFDDEIRIERINRYRAAQCAWRWHHHFTKNHFRSHAHLSSLDSNEVESKSYPTLEKTLMLIADLGIAKQAFTTIHYLCCFSKPTKWYHMVAWTLERWNQVDNFAPAASSSGSSLSFSLLVWGCDVTRVIFCFSDSENYPPFFNW